MKNYIVKLAILSVLAILFASGTAGQDGTSKAPEKYLRIEGSYILGGQVINDNLIYNPGGSINASICLRSGNKTGFGIGGGYTLLNDDSFVPLYFEFTGYMNKKKNCMFMVFQAGYAFGMSNRYKNYTEYSFNGGICFGIGTGYRFRINENLDTYLSITYKHHFASVNYRSVSDLEYKQNLNYELLAISFGFMID